MKIIKLLSVLVVILCLSSTKSFSCTPGTSDCERCTSDLAIRVNQFANVPNWDEFSCTHPNDPNYWDWNFCGVDATPFHRSTDLVRSRYSSNDNPTFWVRIYVDGQEKCFDDSTPDNEYFNSGCDFLIEGVSINCPNTITFEMMSDCFPFCKNDNSTGGTWWKSDFTFGANEFSCNITNRLLISSVELQSSNVDCDPNTEYNCG